jgi:hypothetical protein
MLSPSPFSTYRTSPWLVRLIGNSPPEGTRSASWSPCSVTRNELIVSSPALTTNRRFPPGVRSTEPELSTIGKPNGGVEEAPTPPVLTVAVWVSRPLWPRENTSTLFPAGLLSCV